MFSKILMSGDEGIGVEESKAFALLALFTIGWIGFSLIDFHLTTQNSDCGYTPAEACTIYARYEQQVIIWRGLAVEFAAILTALVLRKR
jgi:hypothetical protein